MTEQMQKLSFLIDQKSIPAALLTEPAPNNEQLEAILQSAMSAPDHGGLQPFRFLTIAGEARNQLSEVFADAARRRGLDDASIQKQRAKPLRSPLIICVIAQLHDAPAIPEVEQILSAGAATQHIQLACHALGFGSIWLTGDNSYDLQVYQALGLDISERIIGFIYVGSMKGATDKKNRGSAKKITQAWLRPQVTDFAI